MKKDNTRLAIEKFGTLFKGAMEKFGNTVPYGPDRMALTPKELSRKLEELGPEGRVQLAQSIGEDKMLELMRKAAKTDGS